MKNLNSTLFSLPRRALIASAVAALIASTSLVAQSGGASGTKYGSGQKNPSQPTTDVNADVKATTEINAQTAATRDKLSWSDRRFVTKAADGGQAEVQVAQLAAQRATNPEVRSFAQKLVDEHSKANSELLGLASQKNVKVDTDDDKDRAYKRLNKKSGSDFDQEFVEHMIDEHEKEIKMFEKASTDAKDADIRSFATKHVANLRAHLSQAQNLRQALMPTGRTDSSGRSSDPASTPRRDAPQ